MQSTGRQCSPGSNEKLQQSHRCDCSRVRPASCNRRLLQFIAANNFWRNTDHRSPKHSHVGVSEPSVTTCRRTATADGFPSPLVEHRRSPPFVRAELRAGQNQPSARGKVARRTVDIF